MMLILLFGVLSIHVLGRFSNGLQKTITCLVYVLILSRRSAPPEDRAKPDAGITEPASEVNTKIQTGLIRVCLEGETLGESQTLQTLRKLE